MQLSSITRQRFANNQWHTDKFKEVVFFLGFQRRKQQKDTANAIDSKRCHTKMHDMEARIPCYQRRIKTIKSKHKTHGRSTRTSDIKNLEVIKGSPLLQ